MTWLTFAGISLIIMIGFLPEFLQAKTIIATELNAVPAAGAVADSQKFNLESQNIQQSFEQPKFLLRRKRSQTVKLCGDILIDMLTMVCGNRRKRDTQNRTFWITNRDQFASFAESRRGVGLAESCCRHACSVRQLRQACNLLF